MTSSTTVLGLLMRAKDLVSTGQRSGIIEAISSLQAEASGPIRDRAYFALLDTASIQAGDASLSVLSDPGRPDHAVELLDATIKRIVATLH